MQHGCKLGPPSQIPASRLTNRVTDKLSWVGPGGGVPDVRLRSLSHDLMQQQQQQPRHQQRRWPHVPGLLPRRPHPVIKALRETRARLLSGPWSYLLNSSATVIVSIKLCIITNDTSHISISISNNNNTVVSLLVITNMHLLRHQHRIHHRANLRIRALPLRRCLRTTHYHCLLRRLRG
jgi:hypothetical protein